ncbi:hypothetical protein T265_07846 [Opisthorchis viverrini]|uniref:GPI ethanolamine phosphate transferase 1 n=1 Tax=Opisthorchis viverrini TaxID=6198 RepID=A0A075AA80_OPIVI|nr:hypothetical protein T265_07846 [Opisthorchis viverrini]KER24479.1 hypothetical protein T265_07846 [Opisthorchis viverrini]
MALSQPSYFLRLTLQLGTEMVIQLDNVYVPHSAVTPIRCLAILPPEGITRAEKLASCPSIARSIQDAEATLDNMENGFFAKSQVTEEDSSVSQSARLAFIHLDASDAIGHAANRESPISRSPQYRSLLRQFDGFLSKIIRTLKRVSEGLNVRVAFVLTADHGMTDSAGRFLYFIELLIDGHGGDSLQETITPLLVWGAGLVGPKLSESSSEKHLLTQTDSYGFPVQIEGRRMSEIQQVDLCPLMAALLGIPIPQNSRGRLPLALVNSSDPVKFQMIRANCLQLIAQLHRPKWIEREFTDRKVRGSNLTSDFRLPLSRFGQPCSIPNLMQPSGGMAARHRKGVTAERWYERLASSSENTKNVLCLQTSGAFLGGQASQEEQTDQPSRMRLENPGIPGLRLTQEDVANRMQRAETLGAKREYADASYKPIIINNNRPAVAPFRCLAAMPHEGCDTARLAKPRQGKSSGRGRVRTTDLPIEQYSQLEELVIAALDYYDTYDRKFFRILQRNMLHGGRLMFQLFSPHSCAFIWARWLKWLEPESADRKVRGSNPTSATRLPLFRLGQPGSISALVLPSGSMAARHRKGVTAERFHAFILSHIEKITAYMHICGQYFCVEKLVHALSRSLYPVLASYSRPVSHTVCQIMPLIFALHLAWSRQRQAQLVNLIKGTAQGMSQAMCALKTVGPLASFLSVVPLLLAVLNYVCILELLMWGFSHRLCLSAASILVSTWPLMDRSFGRGRKTLRFLWPFACILLAIFPLLPVSSSVYNPFLVTFGGLTISVIIAVFVRRLFMSTQLQVKCRYAIFPFVMSFLVAVASLAVLVMRSSTSVAPVVRRAVQLFSWSSLVLPFFLFVLVPNKTGHRLFYWITAMTVPYILLSFGYEVLFLGVFLCVGLLWIQMELPNMPANRPWDLETACLCTRNNRLQTQGHSCKFETFRRALFFVSFFGSYKPMYSSRGLFFRIIQLYVLCSYFHVTLSVTCVCELPSSEIFLKQCFQIFLLIVSFFGIADVSTLNKYVNRLLD